MNIKVMRSIHLYLGVFFTPLLLFFILTGSLQTFNLHEKHKTDSYQPPAIIKSLSDVHKDQRWTSGDVKPESSKPFRWLVLLMAVGLIVSAILGVIMAFKYTKAWAVWACLFGGTVIPCIFLWLAFRGQ